MKMMKILLSLVTMALAVTFLSSCESSKIAYGNSYYFKQTPKKVTAPQKVEEKTLVATVEKEPASITLSAGEKAQRAVKKIAVLAENTAALNTTLEAEKETLSRAEKRELRKERKENQKEMRQELKTLAQEFRAAPEEVKESLAANEVSGNLRIGIILGVVGLLLMLLGSGSVLSLVGLLALVAGLIFILIDVI